MASYADRHITPPGVTSKSVHRTANARRAVVEDMGIDHRRFNVLVAEKLLNSSNVITTLKQVSGEGVAKIP